MNKYEEIKNKLNEKELNFAEYDGSDDTRIFLSDSYSINVHAPTLGKKQYKKMEKELDKYLIENDSYDVYAWNDVSGWDYWYEEGKNHHTECNYIQVTANIKDPDNVNIDELHNDMLEAYNKFETFDTY